MGKHDKKTGKGRLDKFYKLAKEQGYRARSAFKLVHLNRKYDLLSKSKCCIDLCAAPGGWLQVAEKYMPKGSLIVGVDLNPIKPIPHVTTYVTDITTPQCRQLIRSTLHDWKADLVLHDGAPNVGSAWVQDAFTQNELVLQSLKLATDFLGKGGNFVTKVFRSQDYNALMWVFGQLFKSVEATKPPSSRNVSAEIFVVCQDFLAPKHIDPKFLDPKHVFKDVAPLPTSIILPSASVDANGQPVAGPSTSQSLTASANAIAKSQSGSHAHHNVFMPEKKRRHREGYAEGELTNYHVATAMDFVQGVDPVGLLGTLNKIEFRTEEEKAWLNSRHTTSDVLANFEDLRVLGKGDFKLLMKWRLAIRLETGMDVKADKTQDATTEVTVEPMDEEEQISEELKRLHEAKTSRQKKDKKRANEKKQRELLKLQLNMTAPEDLDNDDRGLAGEEMFDLGEGEKEATRRGRSGGLDAHLAEDDGMSDSSDDDAGAGVAFVEDDEVLSSDEERELRLGALEGEIEGMYEDYTTRLSERDAKYRVKQLRLKDKNFDSWHGINDKAGSDSEDDGVDKGYRDQMVRVPKRGEPAVRVPRRGDPIEEEESEEEEGGGWDERQALKAQIGESESDSSDEEGEKKVKKSRARFGAGQSEFGAMDVGDQGGVKTKTNGHAVSSLVTSLNEPAARAQMSRQAQLWFDQGVFKGVDDLAALDAEDEEEAEEEDEDEDEDDGTSGDDEAEDDDEDEDEDNDDDQDRMEVDDESDSESAIYANGRAIAKANKLALSQGIPINGDADDSFEIVPIAPSDDEQEWDVDNEDQDAIKAAHVASKGLLTAEAVSLASRLVNRQTTLSQMVDEGFNRQSGYHKDGLPEWFLNDESKHYKANIPITKEAVAVLKEKQRALDARPIKKVAEAKARKKYKAAQKLEKARKKADGVMETEDLSMGEKARAVAKAMGKGRGTGEKRPDKKVVVARGVNRGVKGRPKGVKGRYKMADPRMRKETRALKRIKKANKKR